MGREVLLSRTTLALSRADLRRLSGVAASTVARIERGDPGVQLNTLVAVADAVGLDLVVSVYPGAAPRLRDSGQMVVAEALVAEAHDRWQAHTEVIAGDHGRSADLVFLGPDEVLHLEIERQLTDYQAQVRRAAEKRQHLAAPERRPVRLVLVIEDTPRNRLVVAPFENLIRRQLPATSREILAAIRAGRPLGRDGVLWWRRRSHRSIGQDSTRG